MIEKDSKKLPYTIKNLIRVLDYKSSPEHCILEMDFQSEPKYLCMVRESGVMEILSKFITQEMFNSLKQKLSENRKRQVYITVQVNEEEHPKSKIMLKDFTSHYIFIKRVLVSDKESLFDNDEDLIFETIARMNSYTRGEYPEPQTTLAKKRWSFIKNVLSQKY